MKPKKSPQSHLLRKPVQKTLLRNTLLTIGLGLVLLAGIFGISATGTITITGNAFIDYDNNQIKSGYDQYYPALTINVYSDEDESGDLSPGDLILGTDVTDASGAYSITMDYDVTSFTQRVLGQRRDAEETVATGSINLFSTDLDMVIDGADQYIIGIAFDTVNVPPAAIISNAYLRFKARYNDAVSNTLTIYGEKAVKADTLYDTPFDISSRTKTTSSVTWNTSPWTANSLYNTSDITSIVSEVINQEGWLPGYPINFIIEGTTDTKSALAGGTDGPELVIEYLLPNKPYIVAIDSNCLAANSLYTEVPLSQVNSSGVDLSFYGKPVLCYAAANNQAGLDQLLFMNRVSGESMTGTGGGYMGTYQVESLTYFPGTNTMFGADSSHLGKIDLITGNFTAYADSFGIGGGAEGDKNLDDVDASALNFFTGEFWAAERKHLTRDYLFKIDTTTGRHVENTFGAGIDYIQISGTGILPDIDDLAIHPVTGAMYATNTHTDTSYAFLVYITPQTGATGIIDTIKYNGAILRDMEGLGFANDATLYGTTGNAASPWLEANCLYRIDLNTATAYKVGSFMKYGRDVEGCNCLSGAPNSLSGYVFTDTNGNGVYDGGETPIENVKIRVYLDDDDDGQLSLSDVILDSVNTNASGYYSWETAAPEDYIMEIDTSSLPNNFVRTSVGEENAVFSGGFGGLTDSQNNFGAKDGGSFPVEWLEFYCEEENGQGKLFWSTAQEINSDYFVVERSSDSHLFQTLGSVRAQGNTDEISGYSYTDKSLQRLPSGIAYYRLKQVDFDGQYEYSPVVELAFNSKKSSVFTQVFPNPVSDMATLDYDLGPRTKARLRIIHSSGKILTDESIGGTNGNGKYKINASHWASGIYFAEITVDDSQSVTRFVVK